MSNRSSGVCKYAWLPEQPIRQKLEALGVSINKVGKELEARGVVTARSFYLMCAGVICAGAKAAPVTGYLNELAGTGEDPFGPEELFTERSLSGDRKKKGEPRLFETETAESAGP